jgi:hypothetical protein
MGGSRRYRVESSSEDNKIELRARHQRPLLKSDKERMEKPKKVIII